MCKSMTGENYIGYFSVFMHNLIYSFAHYKSQFLFVYVIILSYKQPAYT